MDSEKHTEFLNYYPAPDSGLESDEALVDLLTTLVYVRNTCHSFGCILQSLSYFFPPVSSLDLLVGFISTKMSSSGGVIVTGYQDSYSISGNCFNISMIQDAIFHVDRPELHPIPVPSKACMESSRDRRYHKPP